MSTETSAKKAAAWAEDTQGHTWAKGSEAQASRLGAWAQGLGQQSHFLLSPSHLGSAFWTPRPGGSFSRFGSCTFAPLLSSPRNTSAVPSHPSVAKPDFSLREASWIKGTRLRTEKSSLWVWGGSLVPCHSKLQIFLSVQITRHLTSRLHCTMAEASGSPTAIKHCFVGR